MRRTLTITVTCDDDDGAIAPPTFHTALHFEPRLPLKTTASVLGAMADSFTEALGRLFGPQDVVVTLTPEQRAEEDAERAALEAAREPLVRLS